ncbi:MAG: hypothetical protein OIF40_01280 [Mangrovicoccus sp.]|nr:hypothetical protein [Mangrovicoccus sp.]
MSFDPDRARLASVLVFTASLAFAVSPFISGGFEGFTADQFPISQAQAPIVPAPWAFSIWGLIYAGLLVHAFYGMVKRDDDPEWAGMRWPLFVSLGLGASWISVAQQSPVIATVQIWLMLIFALIALAKAPQYSDRWTARAPLAIYAGWLSAAALVSLALCLAGYGIGFDAMGWALAGLIALPVLAMAVRAVIGVVLEYNLAVIWALAGIAAANIATAPAITGLALTGAVGLALPLILKRGQDA